MSKAAANKTTKPKKDEVQQLLETSVIKTQFVGSAINLSWRLVFTVLVPIIVGIQIDKHFHTSPSFVLAGFTIAIFAGGVAIWDEVKEVNNLLPTEEKKGQTKK